MIIISNSKPSSISLNNLTFVLKTSSRSNTAFWPEVFSLEERKEGRKTKKRKKEKKCEEK